MVVAAKDIVGKINELYKGAEFKPVIVLMSSANVSPEMVEDFRRSSGWLAGMFYFINKRGLRGCGCLLYATGIALRKSVRCWLPGCKRWWTSSPSVFTVVADRFVDDVKALHLSDYAYLQMMSLQEDGHPLGDYMLWLFGSYIGQTAVSRRTCANAQRREIDKLVFTDLPGAQAPPSDMLARLYESATVEKVESELGHPRAPEGTAAEPHLHLGDIFVAGQTQEVLVIVSAQCDLEFAPGVASRPVSAGPSNRHDPRRVAAVAKVTEVIGRAQAADGAIPS